MLHCSSCKFWKSPGYTYAQGWGEGWGVCDIASSTRGYPVNKATLAYAEDAETYSADLRTKPDFGCIQHAPK